MKRDITKHHIEKLGKECEEMVKDLGYALPLIRYQLNRRAKQRVGLCSSDGFGEYEISLSFHIVNEYFKRGEIKAIKTTLLHEICHTLPNSMNHGREWQKHVRKVNEAYGYNISRIRNIDEAVKKEVAKTSKYTVTCKDCGKEIAIHRMSGVIRNPERYHCSCGGRLEARQNY